MGITLDEKQPTIDECLPRIAWSHLIGTTLRRQRESQSMTQRELADLGGVSQATVARIERGDRTPSLPVLARLFAALDVQLAITVEPLDAHLDADLADLAGRPVHERIEESNLDLTLDRLGDLPYALTGCTAAMLQAVPIPTQGLEIAVRWADSDRFTNWLTDAYGQRWHDQWQVYGHLRLEPEEPGAHRWWTRYGELRATMCDELPATIEVRHGERSYRVVPLADLEVTDRHAADLLRRYRTRQLRTGNGESVGRPGQPTDEPNRSAG